ncbi:FAD-dependent oxidoreductase [Spirillospora sp. NPDC029432]|uniref:FAD-dependent oxidoreductase n=1 Tax=Spirillospora sp. NPDC029432 TaxID=3154599 RepID=UPI0034542610
MHDSTADVLVVGAGPYGLSTAAYLRHHGLDVRIIGTPMEFWADRMPPGMHLKSEPFASSLGAPHGGATFTDRNPGWRTGRPIPLSVFVEYGRWFAGHIVPYTEEARVERIERPGGAGGPYEIALSTGETARARAVVIAIGVAAFARVPDELSGLPAELLTHSMDHREFGRFEGQEVAVVGAGQSALETAVFLAEAGARPQLLARTERLAWNDVPVPSPSPIDRALRGPASGLGRGYRTWVWSEHPWATRFLPDSTRQHLLRTTMGPAGAWWLRDRVDHRVHVMTGRTVTAARESGGRAAVTTAGTVGSPWEHEVDHVIAATGFRPDLGRIEILAPELRERVKARHRAPVLGSHFQSSVPGLYFAGLTAAPSFGPVMRFVHGADFAARRIAAHIAANAKAAAPPVEKVTVLDSGTAGAAGDGEGAGKTSPHVPVNPR